MPKIIEISAKCSDMFCASLSGDHEGLTHEYSGYVPNWFPNPNTCHYGDYVCLKIDADTGQIVNWKKPTKANLQDTFTPPKE